MFCKHKQILYVVGGFSCSYLQATNFYLLGNYWIDPNGGIRNDAVLAFCHLESQSSCVLPKNVEVNYM